MTSNGADTAVSPETIENAFRLAGFQYGTPDSNDRQEFQPPDDYDVVVRIFDRPTVVRIANTLPNDLALPYNLAASLLEHITLSGYTVTGRQIELESYSVGEVTYAYPTASVYRRSIQRVINALRSQGRQLLAEVIAAGENPSPISPNVSDRIPLTASEVAFIVSEHANLNTAHHTPPSVPDVSDFVSSTDIDNRISTAIANAGAGSGVSSSQVDAKITTHSSDDDAHHTPPDVSGFVGSSEVATAVRNHSNDIDAHHAVPDTSQFLSGTAIDAKIASALATGSGLNTAAVQALIGTHTSDSDAHHAIPDVSKFLTKAQIDTEIANAGTGSGISGSAVDAKIATHASDSDAHHAIPDVSEFLSSTEINTRLDGYTYSKSVIDGKISSGGGGLTQAQVDSRIKTKTDPIEAQFTAINNDIYLTSPTFTDVRGTYYDFQNSVKSNPIMYRHITSPPMQTGSGNPLYNYKVWTDIIPTTALPETENNITPSPRHYRVTLKGGLLWDLRYVQNYLIGYRTRLIMRQGRSSFIREQQNDLNSAQGFLTSRDDESDLEYGLDFDTIVQSNVKAGRISFAVQIYIQNASTTENAAFARQGFNSEWLSDTDKRVPFIVDANFPVLFVIERLDNLATSL